MKKRFSLKKGVAFCTVSVLLRMLSESGPDIIVITGDLVDSTHTDIDTALAFAKEAVQIAPVYYVTGNHEARLTEYERLRTGLVRLIPSYNFSSFSKNAL